MNPTDFPSDKTEAIKPASPAPENLSAPKGEETAPAPHQPQDLNLSLPEGLNWAPDALEKFTALAREIALTPEQAQKLVDLEESCARAARERESTERAEQQRAWSEQTRALFGQNYDAEMARAVAAADAFGGDALRELLKTTGLGNHPVIVRTFNEIGKRISEDTAPAGQAAPSRDKTFTEALYGKHE
jgi:FtsZ-binding cell division protein ZapB